MKLGQGINNGFGTMEDFVDNFNIYKQIFQRDTS
jgi:hypothetical protein